jgi:UPF0176 protein
MDPETDSFRQFQDFAEKLAETDSDRPLAMFCTGGIRCEKAAALMQELGFSEVYQLQGGILNYLENVADSENQWKGECFVFDKRVAVDQDLAEGGYVQWKTWHRPITVRAYLVRVASIRSTLTGPNASRNAANRSDSRGSGVRST